MLKVFKDRGFEGFWILLKVTVIIVDAGIVGVVECVMFIYIELGARYPHDLLPILTVFIAILHEVNVAAADDIDIYTGKSMTILGDWLNSWLVLIVNIYDEISPMVIAVNDSWTCVDCITT